MARRFSLEIALWPHRRLCQRDRRHVLQFSEWPEDLGYQGHGGVDRIACQIVNRLNPNARNDECIDIL